MLATFSAKVQIVHIFGFSALMVSVARTGLFHGTPRAATGNIEMNRAWRTANKTLFTRTGWGEGLAQDCNCDVCLYNIDFLKIMCLGEKEGGKFWVSHSKISAIVLTTSQKQPVYNSRPVQGDEARAGTGFKGYTEIWRKRGTAITWVSNPAWLSFLY